MILDPLAWPGQENLAPVRTPSHLALLGNFPPRRCGLATYTYDTFLALRAHKTKPHVDVYVMDDGQVDGYGRDVTALIPQDDISAYQRTADAINASGAQILWIQHEFGIFGGVSGSHLLALVNRIAIPVAITLHTILEAPSGTQRAVLNALLDRAGTIIVMAHKGRDILQRSYGVDPTRVSVIAHGIPDCAIGNPASTRARLGLPDRPTILTFGLLSPDKGIADMIEAMPAIVRRCPDAHYVVLGPTHPHLKRKNGESYRESLVARVCELGIGGAVSFVDRFLELDELTDWLTAADVYVTPYRNPAQITSGTLSYAIGLGKAVVSTPYVHATEILADDHGMLVPFRSPDALATAVGNLLVDNPARAAMSSRAYARGRAMIWPRNADAALTAMIPALRAGPERRGKLSPVVLRFVPIERMTDDVGMFQHSIFGVADRDHGYCIDDNARGLLLMAVADDLPMATRLRLAHTYASFVQYAWNSSERRFRNFMGYDRRWLEHTGSEDSNGRTLWALGVAALQAPSTALRDWAAKLYDETATSVGSFGSPRARAFAMLGAAYMAQARPDDLDITEALREGVATLMAMFSASRRPDWAWFEIVLSYDNTRLPEALMRAGQILGDEEAIRVGVETLEWIARQTTGHEGMFQPVGTDSFGEPYAEPAIFDQQPLEAWAMIDACTVAWQITKGQVWLDRARAAHGWFLGRNTLGVPLIDAESGECGDGINPFSINRNNGAESVIAWQMAHRSFIRLSDMASQVQMSPQRIVDTA